MTALTAAEARIALLEAELETYKMYKSERDSLERAYDQATKERNHWHDKAQEYRQQSAEYRDSRDKWCEAAVREQLATKDTLPRVITADELREGQVVAIHETDFRIVTSGTVIRVEDGGEVVRLKGHGATILGLNRSDVDEIVLLADAPEEKPNFGPGGKVEYRDLKPARRGEVIQPTDLRVGDVVDVWHGDDNQEPYYPTATIESASPLIADQFDFEGLERSFPRFQFRLLKRPDKKPDNTWFATVYEDATHWSGTTWRGTPVRPQSIRAGDVYDIHTEHGTTITGVLAGRDGVHRPQNGDHYRIVSRAGAA